MEVKTTVLESFVEGSLDSIFSIYNLPYGVFSRKDKGLPRVGTAIGGYVLDLALLEEQGLLKIDAKQSFFNKDSLNAFASTGPKIWSVIRKRIQSLLSIDNYELQHNPSLLNAALIPLQDVKMFLPFKVESFSDFYASEHHATNVGRLFRGNENALLPNWKYIPVGYNGRASTVFPSGTNIRRPKGQIKLINQDEPIFSPTNKLDLELEIGFFVGVGNPDGQPIHVENAKSHIFGLVLLNDWSARDVQAFEYQPLGPFLSKSFATSISHWVVPFEALEEVMSPLPNQIPRPVEYLYQEKPMQPDIKLMVEIKPRGSNISTIISETSAKELYWSMEQMLAHHTVNNCIMLTGDLLGTGTISGPERENWGSLLEISFNGKQSIKLSDGNERTFLEDGDTVIITGYCQTSKGKIGFGSLEGTITASDMA
jgi:fumarylacetoacetase